MILAVRRSPHVVARAIARRVPSVAVHTGRNISTGNQLPRHAPPPFSAIVEQQLNPMAQPFRLMSTDNSKKEEEKAEENTNPAQEEPTEEQPASDEATEEEATSEPSEDPVVKLETEVKELKDQLLRSLAEQENTRRIAQRDIESARQFAIKSFANSLLDVSDNLTRALESVPDEARADKEGNPVLATLYEGIELTNTGLTKAFESNGLVQYGIEGEQFDPNKHDALYEYADESKTPGTIGQVMKSGFMLNNRVLRPAKVGVVKKAE